MLHRSVPYGIKFQLPHKSLTDKCIVLDLDQTLIATQDTKESLKRLGIFSNPHNMHVRPRVYDLHIEDYEKPGSGSKYNFWGIIRPHLHEFLVFCFNYFKYVVVYSAGKRPYVEAIVDDIFRDLPMPHAVFSYDDIIMNSAGQVEKPLTKIIAMAPHVLHGMSLENTLAIDDNPTTFHHNMGNAVLIPAYEPHTSSVTGIEMDDVTLLQLKYWLLQPEVIKNTNVALLDKTTIFTTPIEMYKITMEPILSN
jgi:hypothetical protein